MKNKFEIYYQKLATLELEAHKLNQCTLCIPSSFNLGNPHLI